MSEFWFLCSMCTGEYCAVHHLEPCDCDTAERHGDEPCPITGEPQTVETIWGQLPLGLTSGDYQ